MRAIYKSETGARAIRNQYRDVLRAWPMPNQHIRVPTAEGETFVVASGPEEAPPLVLLHGAGTNTAMWMDDIADWAEHFRVYAVDVIGEPGLSAPSRPPLDSDRHARWLDQVLDNLGVACTSVVGASLGGWLALDHATRRPQRVTQLVLLCPGGIGRQLVGWILKTLPLRPFGRWGRRKTLEVATGLNAHEARSFLESMALTFTHFKPRTEKLPVFSDEALRGLVVPTLAIVGARDAMFDSQDTAGRLERCVPYATVRLLPDAGHSIVGQTERIREFLRQPE